MKLPNIDKNILLGIAAVGAGLLVLRSRGDEPINYSSGGGGAGSNEEEYKKSIEGGAEPTIINFPEMPAASVTTEYPEWLSDWGKDEPIPTGEPIPTDEKGVFKKGDPLIGYSGEQKKLIRQTVADLSTYGSDFVFKPGYFARQEGAKSLAYPGRHPQVWGKTEGYTTGAISGFTTSAKTDKLKKSTYTPETYIDAPIGSTRQSGKFTVTKIDISKYNPLRKKLQVTYRGPSGKPL